ncbi:hypothetical protein TVAG_153740 [Trichomonas vaginalis G3]|uniref:Uncharacterized protein n=1 Tax=Trichomonas vaginalis (strain ATCC PRA-98 / G3) TaxID=412133 RepID=A2EPS9_TRIV3|nr:hypothetical protein TVAGG3_0352430 [Trichomonas vaginalis G3]EAY05340.1 hypothetical protein TVAG_153740 [Trichomonas vaginalis G3]KAI5531383.1 hypothetical protein TVAGG3_0352430 [Trichomonas vaginalis G3]|eukprot:XP_001317563.1 hypothetical protein [Trichomonas vaginalis G3]
MKINELEVGKRMIIADTNWMDRDFTFTRLVISRVSKKLFSLVQTNSTDTCIMKHSIVPIDYKPRFPKPDLPNGDPKSFYLLGYIDKPFDESNTLRARKVFYYAEQYEISRSFSFYNRLRKYFLSFEIIKRINQIREYLNQYPN